MSERPKVLRRALEHYASRLSALQDDREIKLGNNVLKDDLNTNASDALSIANSLRYPENLVITVSDYRKVICSALICYISDLEESKTVVGVKLGGAIPHMKNIEYEIQEAKNAKDEICRET